MAALDQALYYLRKSLAFCGASNDVILLPLSLWHVEDLLFARGIDICPEGRWGLAHPPRPSAGVSSVCPFDRPLAGEAVCHARVTSLIGNSLGERADRMRRR